MGPYKTKLETVSVKGVSYQIQTLLDKNQFYDIQNKARNLGIHSNEWSYFGMLWPSAHVLAEEVTKYPLQGIKILEAGCGIGLASLVAQRQQADITASDFHPLVEEFLVENARLNGLPPISYKKADWGDRNTLLGQFDLIMGSDLVYDKKHPTLLSGFIDRHLKESGKVLLVVPGREHCSKFIKEMVELGFTKTEERFVYPNREATTCRGRVLKFQRVSTGEGSNESVA